MLRIDSVFLLAQRFHRFLALPLLAPLQPSQGGSMSSIISIASATR
jgi:hypothetical protein